MANSTGTFEGLAGELGRALAPLEERLSSGEVRQLLTELGLSLPGSTPLPPALGQ